MRVVAPGKVVLLGEYAVLDGAPAVVAAVDRGVRCEVTPASKREVTTPSGDSRFVDAALDAVGAPTGRYAFSDHRPLTLPGGAKPGLGGSAAATVAAVLAGHRLAGREVPVGQRLAEALAVHRAVQGSGSGVDVAASTLGGVVRFQDGVGVAMGVPDVHLSVVYSGAPAATGPRVAQYLAWGDRREFVAASEAAVAGWDRDPVAALRDAGGALRAMAVAAGVAYWTEGIDALVALAARQGGAGKPSGAGGGDVVVAVFERRDDCDRFEIAAGAQGFAVIPVAIAPAAD